MKSTLNDTRSIAYYALQQRVEIQVLIFANFEEAKKGVDHSRKMTDDWNINYLFHWHKRKTKHWSHGFVC